MKDLVRSLKKLIEYPNKRTVVVYTVLRALVIATMVMQFLHGDYFNVFLCLLTLVMFGIPLIADRRFNIKLPSALEVIILLFIFSAEILGEIQSFYTVIPNWDTMLHTINGFLMAAIGFSMIDILNQSPKFHISMSPVFVAFVAFCFSMSVGVVWEFFEYFMDSFAGMDMQKDWIVNSVSSVMLNPDGMNKVVRIEDITNTVINGSVNGERTAVEIAGYLDIGIVDTMKDLLVNCLGAICFSIIGIFYLKNRDRHSVAEKFIPQLKTEEEIAQTHAMIAELKEQLKEKRRR